MATSTMGSHKAWRKIAKRERRRKIRILHAQVQKQNEHDYKSTEEYQTWLKEQKALEVFETEEQNRRNKEENDKWAKADKISVTKWNELQKKIEIDRLKYLEDEIKIQKEWEYEQQRKKETEEKLRILLEKTKQQQEIFMEQLEQFLSGDLYEPPQELLVTHETKPDMDICPFFMKTGCCRFGDMCSRNHKYPGISKVLLASNFYAHFGLENSNITEYEDDVMLEYEDSDTYKDFKAFVYDVLPEFEKYGEVVQFQVCKNFEKHLRGNTYIEFAKLRSAVAAYRGLHTRWYAGRQLSLAFCNISSWKSAICGLQMGKRCPKGRTCNYLHVFRNPYNIIKREPRRTNYGQHVDSVRSWRWSESPEREIKEIRNTRRNQTDKTYHSRPRSEDKYKYNKRKRF